jgi:hypothetical protein
VWADVPRLHFNIGDHGMETNERRRSDRLRMTIPLVAEGIDAKGQPFRGEAHAVSLNRHGARIKVPKILETGQTIRLVSLRGHGEAEFRIVEPRSPRLTEKGGEYGVESQDSNANIWAIEFQPVRGAEAPDAKALLECCRCLTVALTPLTLLEVDTLRVIGRLGKYCRKCNEVGPWRYAEVYDAGNRTGGDDPSRGESPASLKDGPASGKARQHRRVYMQLRLGVRTDQGELEVSRTEDVSRGGLCFLSEKTYHVGEVVTVICPIHTNRQNIELPARIMRRQSLEGTNQQLYAVQFEPESKVPFAGARRDSTADA